MYLSCEGREEPINARVKIYEVLPGAMFFCNEGTITVIDVKKIERFLFGNCFLGKDLMGWVLGRRCNQCNELDCDEIECSRIP